LLTRIALGILGILAIFVGNEVSWPKYKIRELVPSPTGLYIAKVGNGFFGYPLYETEVYIWAKWAPVPSLIATQVLDALCAVTLKWKCDQELHIICPHPERAPRVKSHP
jgi:hypothetical protein